MDFIRASNMSGVAHKNAPGGYHTVKWSCHVTVLVMNVSL